MKHFADRLADACTAKKTALCVGLDPRQGSLPFSVLEKYHDLADAYEEFCIRVLEIIAPYVPVIKLQMAFFEELGSDGMAVIRRLLGRARSLGLLTILDGKRNDVASTAMAYAEAAFGHWKADALTVNPYLGRDAVEPFIERARRCQGGVFVLVRTSNPGAGLFQDLPVLDDEGENEPLYVWVGREVASWSGENQGRCGMGDVGAVVGATYPEQMQTLRGVMPRVPFLVPGYGAQGGSSADVRAAFREDGLGAIVNSSRGVIFPWKTPPDEGQDWEALIEAAARKAALDLPFPLLELT